MQKLKHLQGKVTIRARFVPLNGMFDPKDYSHMTIVYLETTSNLSKILDALNQLIVKHNKPFHFTVTDLAKPDFGKFCAVVGNISVWDEDELQKIHHLGSKEYPEQEDREFHISKKGDLAKNAQKGDVYIVKRIEIKPLGPVDPTIIKEF